MTRFTLQRSGEFTINTFGQYHCGTSEVLGIKYHIKVVCGEDSLDQRGFLFDQVMVDQMFKSIKATSKSCEVFCKTCAQRVYKTIMQQNGGCKIHSLEVTLSPAPYAASLTFEYAADDVVASTKTCKNKEKEKK